VIRAQKGDILKKKALRNFWMSMWHAGPITAPGYGAYYFWNYGIESLLIGNSSASEEKHSSVITMT
jgi:hypothetical protein